MKKYKVDVFFEVGHCLEVEANSQEEAESKVWEKIKAKEITPYSEGFHDTEGGEVVCVGDENGYFS